MKMIQALLEMSQQNIVLRTNDIDEYNAFIDKASRPDNDYHYEEVPDKNGTGLYDIIVEVFDYARSPQTRHDPESVDIDWDVVYYGSGDFDNERDFYIVKGSIELPDNVEQDIEQRLMEDQDDQKANEYDDRGDYEYDRNMN